MTAGQYFVGVDLGQRRDFTAIAVLERALLSGEWDGVAYAYRKVVQHRIRHVERVKLGTPYEQVAERVKQVVGSIGGGATRVVADATGVGLPVMELLQKVGLGCTLMRVLITGGERENREGGYYRVPKRNLITRVQIMLEQGGLKIAAGLRDGELLVREMADMRVKVSLSGRETFEAWREGAHDDLVLAVALACWGSKKVYPDSGSGGDEYWSRAAEARYVDWRKALPGARYRPQDPF